MSSSLICEDCGKSFPRGKSRTYKAKFCPDCRGKHVGRPSNVTAMPTTPAEAFWEPGKGSREKVAQLSLDQMLAILEDPATPRDERLRIFNIASKWGEILPNKELQEAWKKRSAQTVARRE